MVTDRVGLLQNIKSHRRLRSIRIQGEQERLLRCDVRPDPIRLCPGHIRKSPADLPAVAEGDHKERRQSIANRMEAGRREAVVGRAIDQLPVLLRRSKPIVQHRLQVHLVVLQDLRAGEHVHQQAGLQSLVVL